MLTGRQKAHRARWASHPPRVTIAKQPGKNGYIEVRLLNHPILGSCRTYLHRLRAVEGLGRKLEKGEEVHHKNTNKADNRWPENLEVKRKGEHSRLHSIGHITTEETRRKISAANTGKQRSEETRRRISEGQKGRKRSEEFKRRVSAGLKRHLQSLSTEEIQHRVAAMRAVPQRIGPRKEFCSRGHLREGNTDRQGRCTSCRRIRGN